MELGSLLDDLNSHVRGEMEANPVVVDDDDLDVQRLPIEARRWDRIDEVVAVVADLKGSTNLGVHRHAASTAAIYEAATGGASRVLSAFGANFISIQGDGLFGLFWGDLDYERAVCAAITIKTFSSKHLVPQLERKWPDAPATGFKVGMAASSLLVKKVGIPRTEYQEPVWAGKAVNYAFKCAQQAKVGEMIVTGPIWYFAGANDYLAFTCPCGNGPSPSIWHEEVIEKIHEDDADREGRTLTSVWCTKHGSQYCQAVLDEETERADAAHLRRAAREEEERDVVLRARRLQQEQRRTRRWGVDHRPRS